MRNPESERLPDRLYPPGSELSPREMQMLQALADGLTNPQIARRFWIARSTVKCHVRHILSRLDATNRAQAVAVAYESGILQAARKREDVQATGETGF